jgi:hypothetical protein
MQFYPVSGFFLVVNKENMMKFSKIDNETIEAFVDAVKNHEDTSYPAIVAFLDEFSDRYGVSPDLFYVHDDSEGFCSDDKSVIPGASLLSFCSEDKYTMTVREEWSNLPVEPQQASWCTLC